MREEEKVLLAEGRARVKRDEEGESKERSQRGTEERCERCTEERGRVRKRRKA